jgi:exodeoxyribonuclease VII large subunit
VTIVASSSADQYISVSEFNQRVAALLERSIPLVAVTGEIANFTRAASGHLYFSIKDHSAQVRCVMFRGKAAMLDFSPREGDKVQIRALASFYQARGEFQLTVEQLRKAGAGGLYEEFLRLKAKLLNEGLFEAERKRDLPAHVRRVGVVTSLQAAALKDVLASLNRRAPHVEVIIYPCLVQGRDAPAEIVSALNKASQRAKDRQETDVILLVRGGGAIEDLWAFNDEAVARAIANSHVPVVSGVGHETDTTIADFVADLRAATPTAAAELAVEDRAGLITDIAYLADRLQAVAQRRLNMALQSLDSLTSRLQSPSKQWQSRSDHLDKNTARLLLASNVMLQRLDAKLAAATSRFRFPSVRAKQERLQLLIAALTAGVKVPLDRRQQALQATTQALELLGPPAVLARGYAIVQNQKGGVITKKSQADKGSTVKVILSDGDLIATVQ